MSSRYPPFDGHPVQWFDEVTKQDIDKVDTHLSMAILFNNNRRVRDEVLDVDTHLSMAILFNNEENVKGSSKKKSIPTFRWPSCSIP